jgi:hypothetical protein
MFSFTESILHFTQLDTTSTLPDSFTFTTMVKTSSIFVDFLTVAFVAARPIALGDIFSELVRFKPSVYSFNLTPDPGG